MPPLFSRAMGAREELRRHSARNSERGSRSERTRWPSGHAEEPEDGRYGLTLMGSRPRNLQSISPAVSRRRRSGRSCSSMRRVSRTARSLPGGRPRSTWGRVSTARGPGWYPRMEAEEPGYRRDFIGRSNEPRAPDFQAAVRCDSLTRLASAPPRCRAPRWATCRRRRSRSDTARRWYTTPGLWA